MLYTKIKIVEIFQKMQ